MPVWIAVSMTCWECSQLLVIAVIAVSVDICYTEHMCTYLHCNILINLHSLYISTMASFINIIFNNLWYLILFSKPVVTNFCMEMVLKYSNLKVWLLNSSFFVSFSSEPTSGWDTHIWKPPTHTSCWSVTFDTILSQFTNINVDLIKHFRSWFGVFCTAKTRPVPEQSLWGSGDSGA